jgi:hypothetical protein
VNESRKTAKRQPLRSRPNSLIKISIVFINCKRDDNQNICTRINIWYFEKTREN